MKPIKILRLNRKHLSQMTYYFTSFQDNSCSHDGQSSICRIHSMQYIPVTPNMRDYNLLDSLGVAPDLERILDYAMLYGATYVELTGNDADIDPLLPTFKWTLDNDILYAILKDGEQMQLILLSELIFLAIALSQLTLYLDHRIFHHALRIRYVVLLPYILNQLRQNFMPTWVLYLTKKSRKEKRITGFL